jgi:UDP-N-acetylglucosamine--N-acetylmuramyl-(pentapeptide) pyrophosphoryl-undecaprenol N-acetylglucosamine transferase
MAEAVTYRERPFREHPFREHPYRIMISGGGTGGHIYPAISIAQALEKALSSVEIRFVGAKGKMEMKKVPEAGFEIIGLWISGLQRKLTLDNLLFPIKLISSVFTSFKLLAQFMPDVVIGVGGYASGPLLIAATIKRIPTLIQEQNSYAGLTNKWLAKYVTKVCVAHDGMEKYFPGEKIVVTGNPVRSDIKLAADMRRSAFEHFGFDTGRSTILIIGGSLGARTINESLLANLDLLIKSGVQVLWQTGGFYFEEMKQRTADKELKHIQIRDFIKEMKYAYAIADVVISRSGALSIAELMLTGKPAIMVPSPNVAEDHQTKNAMALVERNAAVLVKDTEALEKMVPEALRLLDTPSERETLESNIAALAHPNAAMDIANEIIKLVA